MAELLQTCGEAVPREIYGTSAAEIEHFLENRFAEHDLRRYIGNLETDADNRWTYTLVEEGNAEDEFLTETVVGNHTKMMLARHLERFNGEDRRTSWGMSLANLRARVQALGHLAVVPPAPLAAAPRGRRGRGHKGRGKGGRAR